MLGARATFYCHTAPRQFTCLWLHRLIFCTHFCIFSCNFLNPLGIICTEGKKIIIIIIIKFLYALRAVLYMGHMPWPRRTYHWRWRDVNKWYGGRAYVICQVTEYDSIRQRSGQVTRRINAGRTLYQLSTNMPYQQQGNLTVVIERVERCTCNQQVADPNPIQGKAA